MIQGFGINVTLKELSESFQLKAHERLNELNVRWIRLEFDYYGTHRPQDFDPLINACQQSGIAVLGLLTGLVPGTLRNLVGNPKRFPCPVDELPKFLDYLETYVCHFGDKICAWEVWNEQNTARFWGRAPKPEEYAKLITAASAKIRDLAPNAQICFGSLCGNDIDFLAPGIPRHWLPACLEFVQANAVDAIGFHPYSLGCYVSINGEDKTFKEITRRWQNFLDHYKAIEKPFWVTEIGVSRWWIRLTATEIASLYQRLIRFAESRSVPICLWCLTDFDDPTYAWGNPETRFGLTHPNLDWNAVGTELLQLSQKKSNAAPKTTEQS